MLDRSLIEQEWNQMWNKLRNMEINKGDPKCRNASGDVWRYVKTTRIKGVITHILLHKNHAHTNKPEMAFIEAVK